MISTICQHDLDDSDRGDKRAEESKLSGRTEPKSILPHIVHSLLIFFVIVCMYVIVIVIVCMYVFHFNSLYYCKSTWHNRLDLIE